MDPIDPNALDELIDEQTSRDFDPGQDAAPDTAPAAPPSSDMDRAIDEQQDDWDPGALEGLVRAKATGDAAAESLNFLSIFGSAQAASPDAAPAAPKDDIEAPIRKPKKKERRGSKAWR